MRRCPNELVDKQTSKTDSESTHVNPEEAIVVFLMELEVHRYRFSNLPKRCRQNHLILVLKPDISPQQY